MKSLILLLAFSLSPAFAQIPSSHYYAVQTHLGQLERTDIDSLQMEAQLGAVHNAGLTSIRDECWWSEVEKTRGVFNFPNSIDRLIRAAQRRGISVLMILNYNNPLYAPHAGAAVTTDSNRAGFARYCQEVVKRYAPLGVKYYEIWNEPNIRIFWDPQPVGLDYASLLKVAYPAIKKADPTVTVLAGATSPSEGNPPRAGYVAWLPFLTEVFQNGGGSYMDGVSFHLYRVDRGPESHLAADIQNLQNIVGKDRQFWMTEVGYPTSAVWPNLTLDNQANYVARLYLLGRSFPQLSHISYYDLRNDGTKPDDNEHNFGLLLNDMTPKPAFSALRSVTSFVGSKAFNGMTRVGNTYALSFGQTGERTVAVWSSGAAESRAINTGVMRQIIYNRDGKVVGYAHGDSLVRISSTQQPKYIVATISAPRLKGMRFNQHWITLDPQQTFQISIAAEGSNDQWTTGGARGFPDTVLNAVDTSTIPYQLHPRVLQWRFVGTGGSMDQDGIFRPSGAGNGILIGSYGGFSDTAAITIVRSSGAVMLEDFETGNGWQ